MLPEAGVASYAEAHNEPQGAASCRDRRCRVLPNDVGHAEEIHSEIQASVGAFVAEVLDATYSRHGQRERTRPDATE